MSGSRSNSWSVSSPSGFFRVFDVAFFLPGTLLTSAVWLSIPHDVQMKVAGLLGSRNGVGGTITTAFAGATLLAAVFLGGLLVHAVHRTVYGCFKWLTDDQPENLCGSPATVRKPELQLYFWNLASLSWNLEAAVLLGAILLTLKWQGPPTMPGGFVCAAFFPFAWALAGMCEGPETISVVRAVSGLVIFVLAIAAGSGFDRSIESASYWFTVLALVLLGFSGWGMRCAYWKNGAGEAAPPKKVKMDC